MSRIGWNTIRDEEGLTEALSATFITPTASATARMSTQIGCKNPCQECVAFEYAQATSNYGVRSKYRCVRNLTDPPKGLANQVFDNGYDQYKICENAILDWKPALNPQMAKKRKKSFACPPEGKSVKVRGWLMRAVTVAAAQSNEGVARAARDLLYDTNHCTHEDWNALIAFVWNRLQNEQPWKVR